MLEGVYFLTRKDREVRDQLTDPEVVRLLNKRDSEGLERYLGEKEVRLSATAAVIRQECEQLRKRVHAIKNDPELDEADANEEIINYIEDRFVRLALEMRVQNSLLCRLSNVFARLLFGA